jgi:hypothetical protein
MSTLRPTSPTTVQLPFLHLRTTQPFPEVVALRMENSAVVWPLCPEREKEEAEFCDSDTVQFKCKRKKNFKTKKKKIESSYISFCC